LEDARNLFETTSVLLPKSQEIPNLLRNISDLGRSAGLDFISFVPGQEIPKDFYAEIPIDIKIKGPYHNLGVFLDKVSKLERIVSVNNIKTEKVEYENNEILLHSNCRLITYRFTNVKIEQPKKK
jgi:type IV pilus assembly protein PilO